MGGRLNLRMMGSLQHTVGKSIHSLSKAAQKLGSQHLQGLTVYSIFMKFVVKPFLLKFSRTLHHIPLSSASVPLQNTMCLMGKCSHNHFLQTASQNIIQQFLV